MSNPFDLLLEESPFKALEDTRHFAKRLETFQLTWKKSPARLDSCGCKRGTPAVPRVRKPKASGSVLKGRTSSEPPGCQHLPVASGVVPESAPCLREGRWLQAGLTLEVQLVSCGHQHSASCKQPALPSRPPAALQAQGRVWAGWTRGCN